MDASNSLDCVCLRPEHKHLHAGQQPCKMILRAPISHQHLSVADLIKVGYKWFADGRGVDRAGHHQRGIDAKKSVGMKPR